MEMEAYHIRTDEPNPYDPIGMDYFTLHSLLIPRGLILIGYTPHHDKREGAILSYPYNSICARRLEALANGQDSYEGVSVLGKVIGTLQLEDELVERIRKNYDSRLLNHEKVYHSTKHIGLGWDFEGSTEELLYILSGGYVKKDKPQKGKRIRIPFFSKPTPVLEPLPSL